MQPKISSKCVNVTTKQFITMIKFFKFIFFVSLFYRV